MPYRKSFVIACIALHCLSCKQQQLVSGQLKNLTGLESCSWIIELDQPDKHGNKKLEPGNLSQFNIHLAEGQKVKLRYKETSTMSTCMAGKPVELEVITDK